MQHRNNFKFSENHQLGSTILHHITASHIIWTFKKIIVTEKPNMKKMGVSARFHTSYLEMQIYGKYIKIYKYFFFIKSLRGGVGSSLFYDFFHEIPFSF